jgi:hypothetical protein
MSKQIYPDGCPEGTEEMHHPTPMAGHHVLETCQSHPSRYQSTNSARTLLTINLANQKNGKKNAKLYHTHLGDDDFSPTKALAQLVHEIQDLHESTNLGTYQEAGQAYQVINKDIILMVLPGTILDNLGASGFDQTSIGTHSL